jgi:hypothetical protein
VRTASLHFIPFFFSLSILYFFSAFGAFFDFLNLKSKYLMNLMNELPVIQKTYDLIKWYIPIINKLPKNQRFALGDKITNLLYTLLEDMIIAKHRRDKIVILEMLNAKIDILRHQSRLLFDFGLIAENRYAYISTKLHEIGSEIGGWLKQQKQQKVKLL